MKKTMTAKLKLLGSVLGNMTGFSVFLWFLIGPMLPETGWRDYANTSLGVFVWFVLFVLVASTAITMRICSSAKSNPWSDYRIGQLFQVIGRDDYEGPLTDSGSTLLWVCSRGCKRDVHTLEFPGCDLPVEIQPGTTVIIHDTPDEFSHVNHNAGVRMLLTGDLLTWIPKERSIKFRQFRDSSSPKPGAA